MTPLSLSIEQLMENSHSISIVRTIQLITDQRSTQLRITSSLIPLEGGVLLRLEIVESTSTEVREYTIIGRGVQPHNINKTK